MNSARMATTTIVTCLVALASVSCGLAQAKVGPVTLDCSPDHKDKVEYNVSKSDTTLELKCNEADNGKVNPPFGKNDFKVCTDTPCTQPQLLSTYVPGATGKQLTDVTATVTIQNLPDKAKDFYVRCGPAETDPCYIVVHVAPSKSVEHGTAQDGVTGGSTESTGGVTSGSPLSCAKAGGAITIKIPEQGSTAQFKCGDMTLYPRATDRVFAEDCKKEESLKDIVRSDKDNVYTLTASKKPPKKKWCYLCASSSVSLKDPGKASDYCVVHVESSSRTQSSSAIALAVMLPCLLHMLRIT